MPRKKCQKRKSGYRRLWTKTKKGVKPYGSRSSFSTHVTLCSQFETEGPNSKFQGFDVEPLKPPLRVLSLFDGIGSALYILEKLSLHVEVYFSCEIDAKAIRLQQANFQDRITSVGAVESLTQDKLDLLGPINFLIGGSPCSDLSLVNPRRRGLYGSESTGKLFFNFVSIRNHLMSKAASSETQFLWLFENTSHLETQCLRDMIGQLGCEPIMRCASEFLPVARRRYLWGNIPGLQSPVTACTKLALGDVLCHGREPLVDTLPTLTTSSSSQRTGRDRQLPVRDGGEDSPLYIVEMEQLFGFPPHFTDEANLSVTDRRRLLGKAFAVPVFVEVLRPLKELFMGSPHKSFQYGPTDASLP